MLEYYRMVYAFHWGCRYTASASGTFVSLIAACWVVLTSDSLALVCLFHSQHAMLPPKKLSLEFPPAEKGLNRRRTLPLLVTSQSFDSPHSDFVYYSGSSGSCFCTLSRLSARWQLLGRGLHTCTES